MTQDEIIRMAREAGMKIYKGGTVKVGDGVVKTKSVISTDLNELERFVAHEREACAKVCDDIGDSDNGYGCDAAIRARSEK